MMSNQEQIGQVLLIVVGMTLNLVLLVSSLLHMCTHILLLCINFNVFFSMCEYHQFLEVVLYFSHMNLLLMAVPG